MKQITALPGSYATTQIINHLQVTISTQARAIMSSHGCAQISAPDVRRKAVDIVVDHYKNAGRDLHTRLIEEFNADAPSVFATFNPALGIALQLPYVSESTLWSLELSGTMIGLFVGYYQALCGGSAPRLVQSLDSFFRRVSAAMCEDLPTLIASHFAQQDAANANDMFGLIAKLNGFQSQNLAPLAVDANRLEQDAKAWSAIGPNFLWRQLNELTTKFIYCCAMTAFNMNEGLANPFYHDANAKQIEQ